MRRFDWNRWPLAAKLSLLIGLMLSSAIVVVMLLSVQREEETFRRELQGQAEVVLETIELASIDSLYVLNVQFLRNLMTDIGTSRAGLSGRVYDADGRILADSDSDQSLFSTTSDPLGSRLAASETVVFEWSDAQLLAGKRVSAGPQHIGAISITLPTAPLLTKIDVVRNQGLARAAMGVVIGSLLALLISRTITKPLREMQEATERIAGGDFTHRIGDQSGSEFRALGTAFNKMAAQIESSVNSLEQRAKELQIANERAVEASRLKSEFLATMSHELRTPLNAVIGFSGIMIEDMAGEIDAIAKGMVQGIFDSSQHLLGLINDILDIAKIEAGRVELVVAPISTSQLVDEWSTRIGVLASRKNIGLDIQVSPVVPATICGDQERITQIANNLLSNAVKFTDQGKVTLQIDWIDAKFVIQVADTGIGIPPHALQYIFDEFRQVDNSSKRQYGGTGLGLAIVRKLCGLMEGDITVKSQQGEGSTFTVTLPLEVFAGEVK
jgi:two-component system, NtrC family, sensor kinase